MLRMLARRAENFVRTNPGNAIDAFNWIRRQFTRAAAPLPAPRPNAAVVPGQAVQQVGNPVAVAPASRGWTWWLRLVAGVLGLATLIGLIARPREDDTDVDLEAANPNDGGGGGGPDHDFLLLIGALMMRQDNGDAGGEGGDAHRD